MYLTALPQSEDKILVTAVDFITKYKMKKRQHVQHKKENWCLVCKDKQTKLLLFNRSGTLLKINLSHIFVILWSLERVCFTAMRKPPWFTYACWACRKIVMLRFYRFQILAGGRKFRRIFIITKIHNLNWGVSFMLWYFVE